MVAVQLPDGASLERTENVAGRGRRGSRSKTPGVEQVIAIAGISVLDNSATLANAGVAYVILKDWANAARSEQDLRSICPRACIAALARLPDGRRYRARRRRRSRASAMPAASPCRWSCGTAASTIGKLQDLTDAIVAQRQRPDRALQRVITRSAPRAAARRRHRSREGGDAARFGRRRFRRRSPAISARPMSTSSTSSAARSRSMCRPIAVSRCAGRYRLQSVRAQQRTAR